ncbi:type IV secretion protein Rhs [Erwinia sp. D4-22]
MSNQGKEGKLRLITLGEIGMARQVYHDAIDYSRVWVHCDSYLPFGLQKENYAMTPNGEMWFREQTYKEDFSANTVLIEDKHLFMHELGHVWQHQHGQWVRMRGLVSWAADYYYELNKSRLVDYSLEQQASILADYWLLLVYGIDTWHYYQQPGRAGRYKGKDNLRDIASLYQKIVTGRN